jgi:hypothetical protein
LSHWFLISRRILVESAEHNIIFLDCHFDFFSFSCNFLNFSKEKISFKILFSINFLKGGKGVVSRMRFGCAESTAMFIYMSLSRSTINVVLMYSDRHYSSLGKMHELLQLLVILCASRIFAGMFL